MSKHNTTTMQAAEMRASVALSAIYALRMLGMFLMLPVLALYAAGLPGAENKPALIGLAMGMYGLTQALLQLPLGMASDRFGRKKVIYLGLAVFAFGSFMAAMATSLEMLVLARAVQGAGAVSAAVTALLADLTREEVRTRAMAMIGLSIGVTFSVSLVLAPLFNHWIGVPGIFVLTGVLTVLSMLVVRFMVPDPVHSKLHEDAEVQRGELGTVLRNRQLLRLNFGIFALHAAQMALFVALPFMLVHLGLAKSAHWHIYLPATMVGLVLMVPAIIYGETRNRLKTVFVAGIAAIALAQLGLAAGLASLWAVLAWMVLYFIGFNILEATLPSMVSKIAPTRLKGTAMGVYNTAQSIGLFVGGAAGGLIWQHFGTNGVFVFCSGLMLCWLLLAATAPAPQPVRNLMFAVGAAWQGREDGLQSALLQLAAVQAVSFSADGQTVYIKALQQGFDREVAEKLIMGV